MQKGASKMESIWQTHKLAIIAVLVLLAVAASSIVIVPETHQAVKIRTGKPVSVINRFVPDAPYGQTGAGMWYRIPLVERIQMVDRRILDLDERVARAQARRRLPELGAVAERERLVVRELGAAERHRVEPPGPHRRARPERLPRERARREELLLLDLGRLPGVLLLEQAELEQVGVRHRGVAVVEESLQLGAREAERLARLLGDAGEGAREDEAVVELAGAERDLVGLGVHHGGFDVHRRRRRADLPAELAPREDRLEEHGGELVVGPHVGPVVAHGRVEVERVAGQRRAVAVEAGGDGVAGGQVELREVARRVRLPHPGRREVPPRRLDGDLRAPVERAPHRLLHVEHERVRDGLRRGGERREREEDEEAKHRAGVET